MAGDRNRSWCHGAVDKMTRNIRLPRTAAADYLARADDWASPPRIDRLALERQHIEGAFLHAAQGLACNEAMQRFQPKRALAQSQRALAAKTAVAQPLQPAGQRVLRAMTSRRYSRPRILIAGCTRPFGPRTTKVAGFITTPSPPLHVSVSHRAVASSIAAASFSATSRQAVASSTPCHGRRSRRAGACARRDPGRHAPRPPWPAGGRRQLEILIVSPGVV